MIDRRRFLTSGISTIALSRMVKAIEPQTLWAETVDLIGGASNIIDHNASAGYLISLTQPGQGATFTRVRAGSKLIIRYASMSAGTISVSVNDKPAGKVNVHSSGALTGSYLRAIADLAIPVNAAVTISLASDDVGVNIDRIVDCGGSGFAAGYLEFAALPDCGRSLFRRLEGSGPELHGSRVVARCQVRRMGALGSAIHARAG